MPTFNPAKDIPSDFYSAKTFFTLSGAAASVWIFCLVVGAIFPSNAITPLQYRIIAIALSEIIALLMVLRGRTKKIENWFLAIFNGLLIFVNASGWNVITTNNFFSDKIKNAPTTSSTSEFTKHNQILAGFHFFKNQIYWWQDNSVFVENAQLKEANKSLQEKIVILSREVIKQMPETGPSNAIQIRFLKDSFLNEINKRENSIKELNSQISYLKSTNNKSPITKQVVTDTLPSEERKRLLYSMRILQENYENKLKICDNENKELQSKLNIIKHGLDKYGGMDH